MRNRGVGFLEMLAMEMKASGKYVSRGLSFRQAEFATEEAVLTRQQTKSYNDAARFMAAPARALRRRSSSRDVRGGRGTPGRRTGVSTSASSSSCASA